MTKKKSQTLRDARFKANLSQSGLAILSGLTQVTISLIENGRVRASPNSRNRIEGVLARFKGGSVDWAKTENGCGKAIPIEHVIRAIEDYLRSGDMTKLWSRIHRLDREYFEIKMGLEGTSRALIKDGYSK